MRHLLYLMQNYIFHKLLYQLNMIINYYRDQKQDLKESFNGINTDQK